MNRRDAIARVSLIMGGALIGGEFLLTGCGSSGTDKKSGEKGAAEAAIAAQPKEILDKKQVAYLNEVGEIILPTTATPGAKAADVGGFMAVMVRDCYKPADQETFVKGLDTLEEVSKKQNGKGFLESTPEQRTALLKALDAEQKAYSKTKSIEAPNHYFRMIKELTLLGYLPSYLPGTGK